MSSPFDIYNPHTLSPVVHSENYENNSNFLIAVFIDPGIVNCAVRISKYDLLSNTITTILQTKLNFKNTEHNGHYQQSSDILSKYLDLFKWSHYIVIEKQMKINYSLLRFSQHIISFLIIKLKNLGFRPLIYEIDSTQKSKCLGITSGMKKKDLKKACIVKAMEILALRKDLSTIDNINKDKKKDDHCDVICYDEVWWNYIKNNKFNILRPSITNIIAI